MFSLFGEMEPLNLKWPSRRGKIEGSLYGNGEEAYKKAWNVCLKACPELELWTEQLMVYFVFTYFCGSVYNENPYGKLKMALASVLIIQDMALERFMEQGSLDVKAMADAAHTYSREVEHSDENRLLLEERLTKDPRFGLRDFLGAML